ncbi:GNAT family N-acetyltransferase [Actinomadura rupiterrae]|uniref:GNAT family N-acetyltransferase n=1 Tax=Actinomadura rupiterrae TaxID=559627 RepID=UPI0020A41CFB|nr:GNAT family N-acetyltransferase [Actinomadura rupiterrae]MCP2337830.1 RimJ/RimL family protein N-acetyltransferase [Actinomadura rupiterrae]
MLADLFPLLSLRVRTPRLELRLPTDEQLASLAELAVAGVLDRGALPFATSGVDVPPAVAARQVVLHHWRLLGGWRPDDWSLGLVVLLSGEVVGTQGLDAARFAVRRQVTTWSWLGREFEGQGIGSEMRAAVLHLAFAGLDAVDAVSGAYADNEASRRVSRKLGYRPDGAADRTTERPGGGPGVRTGGGPDGRTGGGLGVRTGGRSGRAEGRRMRLCRDDWNPPVRVDMDGLEPCLPLFGIAPDRGRPGAQGG